MLRTCTFSNTAICIARIVVPYIYYVGLLDYRPICLGKTFANFNGFVGLKQTNFTLF